MNLKKITSWGAAWIAAFFIINVIDMFYCRNVGWIELEKGPTDAVWNPGRIIIYAMEGFGIHNTDKNGYLNSGEIVDDDYIIAIGSSHTQGRELMDGKRYTDILNRTLGNGMFSNGRKRIVYNISQDGFYFNDIVRHFNVITNEFPNSRAVVIEIKETTYHSNELREACSQIAYDADLSGRNLTSGLPFMKQFSMAVKETFPFYNVLKKHKKVFADKMADREWKSIGGGEKTMDAVPIPGMLNSFNSACHLYAMNT